MFSIEMMKIACYTISMSSIQKFWSNLLSALGYVFGFRFLPWDVEIKQRGGAYQICDEEAGSNIIGSASCKPF
jgi:hypothetical protein